MSDRNKDNLLLEFFCKFLFEYNFIDELLSLEAGATKEEILRDTDFIIKKKGNNNKPFIDITDNVVLVYSMVYLPGRMVYFGHYLEGSHLSKLFSIEEMQQVNEDNAIEMISSKRDQILASPHTFMPGYDPNVIYYRRINAIRLFDNTKKTNEEIQVLRIILKDLNTYSVPIMVFKEDTVKDQRWDFLDVEDLRFFNSQIAEQELKNS